MPNIKLINENGVIKAVDTSTGNQVPVELESLTTEKINNEFVPGFQTAVQNVTDDANYHVEPIPLVVNNDEVLVVNRVGDSHIDNSGKLVGRLYNFRTGTFGTQFDIADDATYDDRNHSVIHDEDSGRIVVMYRTADAATNSTQAIYTVESNVDTPTQWSSRTDITSTFSASVSSPFGNYAITSNGLMVLGYGTNYAEAIFSTDGGQTWGSPTTVIDTTGTDEIDVREPTPVAITEDKIVVIGREHVGNSGFAVRSSDGGGTWESDFWYVHAGSMDGDESVNFPLWAERTGEYVTTVWGDRHNMRGYVAQIANDRFWTDPSLLAVEPARSFWEERDQGDWGYPTFCQVGANPENLLVFWYSTRASSNADIWMGSLPANVDGAGNKRIGGGYQVDFDQGISDWATPGGSSGIWSTSTASPVYTGQQSLKASITASDDLPRYLTKAHNLPRYLTRGDTLRFRAQLSQSRDEVAVRPFAQTNRFNPAKYEVVISSEDSQIRLVKRTINRSGTLSTTTLDSASVTVSNHLNEWLTGYFQPQQSGDINVDVFDATGTSLASLGVQDFSFSFGGMAFVAQNHGTVNATTIVIDDVKIL